MIYSYYRYVAGKPIGIVAAKGNTSQDAVTKLSQTFSGVFLSIRNS